MTDPFFSPKPQADTFDDVCKTYMSEILDLRQQVRHCLQ